MKKIIYFLVFSLTICYANAQQYKIDSLKQANQILLLKARIDSINAESSVKQEYGNSPGDLAKLKRDILAMQSELMETQYNLFKCHREYKTGTFLVYGGAFLVLLAAILPQETTYSPYGSSSTTANPLALPFAILGSASWITGAILRVDSHRYIGYAGRNNPRRLLKIE